MLGCVLVLAESTCELTKKKGSRSCRLHTADMVPSLVVWYSLVGW